jgi:hypothetical protein
MPLTLTSMIVCEQLMALSLCYAVHEDAIGAMSVEIPFHQRVSLSQMDNPLSSFIWLKKDVIPQVIPDLGHPFIKIDLIRLTL